MFASWRRDLPAEIRLVPVQLPGREERCGEPLQRDLSSLVRLLLSEQGSTGSSRTALFGHSMGALLAFETARVLHHEGSEAVAHLFVSSCAPPDKLDKTEHVSQLSDDGIFERLNRRYGGVNRAVLEDEAARAWYAAVIRADMEMVETYESPFDEKLSCPITALSGSEDATVSSADVIGWRRYTSGPFSQRMFPGGHFYLDDRCRDVVTLVARKLQPRSIRAGANGRSGERSMDGRGNGEENRMQEQAGYDAREA